MKEISSIHLKNHISFHICDCCYRIISEEFKLIECEKELGRICSIRPSAESLSFPKESRDVGRWYQWRLMIFLVDVINVPPEFSKVNSTMNVRYFLDNKSCIEESWKVRTNSMENSSGFFNSAHCDVRINKVKVHYFYSEQVNIDSFLKDTEVHL